MDHGDLPPKRQRRWQSIFTTGRGLQYVNAIETIGQGQGSRAGLHDPLAGDVPTGRGWRRSRADEQCPRVLVPLSYDMPMIAAMIDRIWRVVPLKLRDILVPTDSALRRIGRRWRHSALPHDAIYTAAYFAWVDETARASADAIVASIVHRFGPNSVIDVGCGTGAVLEAFKRMGVVSSGLERAEAARALCRQRGLNVQNFDLEHDTYDRPGGFDLAVCLEVAEHVHAPIGERLVKLLSTLADTVVFTAATPGQGGKDHVNEQPHAYWIASFRRYGFALDDSATQAVRAEWEAAATAEWYHRNALIFRRSPPPT
jgi:SAM-dependent methyltransferase